MRDAPALRITSAGAVRERAQPVCDGLATALRVYGVPEQVLTDSGKVFTGRFNHPPLEVLFDRICRENGIEHLLTQPRSPTTTVFMPGPESGRGAGRR
jgi:transposase InsO family protein